MPRRQCKECGTYFSSPIIQERLGDFDAQKGSNITRCLRRIATLCGASWPYEQAAHVIVELTGVAISHNQIMTLCDKEGTVIETEWKQLHDVFENDALVEMMESLVDYLAQEEEDNSTVEKVTCQPHQVTS